MCVSDDDQVLTAFLAFHLGNRFLFLPCVRLGVCGMLTVCAVQVKIGSGCCFCVLFITGVILFSVSFGTLTPVRCHGCLCLCMGFADGENVQTQAGIRYNNNLVSIETVKTPCTALHCAAFPPDPVTLRTTRHDTPQDSVYNNGRYFLGLGVWFISFPTNAQLVEYTGLCLCGS